MKNTILKFSSVIFILITLATFSSCLSTFLTSEPNSENQTILSLAGKSYEGRNDWGGSVSLSFSSSTECKYTTLNEPPADSRFGTYVINGNKITCTFTGPLYWDLGEDGLEIQIENVETTTLVLTSSDDFETLVLGDEGDEIILY